MDDDLEKPDIEPDIPHITFHHDDAFGRRGRTAETDDSRGQPSVGRSRSRSRSRHRAVPSTATYGLPIGYRTLSIHVSDSQHISAHEDVNVRPLKDETGDYFANLKFHTLSGKQVCQQLGVEQEKGLDEEEAVRRRQKLGPNVLPRPKSNYLKKLFSYVFGGFCSVLWVGSIIFFVCWKPLSHPPSSQNLALAVLILIVIFLQASFNALQDWSTQRTLTSITGLLPSETLVVRNGDRKRVPASDLVDGDIVHLQVGNKVPADLRLLSHSNDVRFDRGVLTGESVEVEGTIDSSDTNFLESRNIALTGTTVVNGNAVGVVVLTGARSVMGRVAHVTASVKEESTLIQKEIWRFVMIIIVLTVLLALLIFTAWIAWLRRDHPGFMNVVQMLNDVMGTVVAFIPEGMPVAVTLTLMMVARRMKAVNILPKGLSVVETLGCVNVLCSDKTGTLTQNQMAVQSVAFVDKQLDSPEAFHDALSSADVDPNIEALRRGAALCNEATFDPATIHLPVEKRTVEGNATDAAVLKFAAAGNHSDNFGSDNAPVYTLPFNSKNKFMVVVNRSSNNQHETKDSVYHILIKGAPDVLLPGCTQFRSAHSKSVQPLDESGREKFHTIQNRLSNRAERVVVICEKTASLVASPGTNAFSDEVFSSALMDLTIIGMLGIIDPPRPEVAKTVAECRRAGVRFFMVTGDYGLTAAAIARSIGIFTSSRDPDTFDTIRRGQTMPAEKLREERLSGNGASLLLEGSFIGRLTQEDWDIVCEYNEVVFARTTPEQKLRIVNELRTHQNTVAVTGDGVNDAPALRAADVGVAVVTGSDVAIEAADLVLLDKFDSIVEAIRLGRLVFQNLQRVIGYLLPAGSWSEIWPVLVNVFFGVPLPLSVFLMIIICVFTDLFLSLSLIMEKEEFNLMSLPPRDPRRDHLVTFKIYAQAYFFTGCMETVIAHSMFFLYYWKYAHIPIKDLFFLYQGYEAGFHGYTLNELNHFNQVGQSVYFVCLVILQWGNILAIRNRRLSIVQSDPIRKPRRNPWLILSVILSLIIAIFVTEVPGLQHLFLTASVPIEFWFIPIPLALGILCMDELRKLLVRLFPKGPVAKVAW